MVYKLATIYCQAYWDIQGSHTSTKIALPIPTLEERMKGCVVHVQ